MGLGEKAHIVHLVDYGLAVEYYRNPVQCKNHVPAKPGRGLTGTARYASINAHQGVSQAPRDDMEALLHTLIYFLKGSLPWQSIQGEVDKQRADRILECKMSTPVSNKQKNRLYPGSPYRGRWTNNGQTEY
uniref:Casein kinase I n=1 Tax=Cacopsylla melanoneura TaxID=428564 RepID=A0A8D8VGZ4_9HEMI